jgi:hypothetical protein
VQLFSIVSAVCGELNKIYKSAIICALATVMSLSLITSSTTSVYSTVEDDGWVEGEDDSQGEISSQEELEEAYEGTEWEDDIGSNEFEEATSGDSDDDDDDNDEQDEETVVCSDGSVVSENDVCPQILPYCDTDEGKVAPSCHDRYDYDVITGLYPCADGSQVSNPLYCGTTLEPETPLNELGGTASLAPGQVPLENKPCLYDTSLPQCQPVNGKCPDDYGMNEDDQCFPLHPSGCPNDYHSHEDDESGECIPNNIPCSQGYIMTVMTNGGDNCEQKQKQISCIDVPFYMTCDSQKKRNDNKDSGNDKTKVIEKTTVIQSASAASTVTANEADISNCKLDGSTDGIQQKFNPVRYQACGLYTYADKAYYDGFVAGCMQVGNTKLICETVANSNIVTPSPTQTQITNQPTQAIQPAAVS